MSQSVEIKKLFPEAGEPPAICYRISNNTGDYIEVTNCGCRLLGLCINDLSRERRDIAGEKADASSIDKLFSSGGRILSGELGEVLSGRVWDIAEEGDNYVFFTTSVGRAESRCGSEIKAGVRIMWVNLSRLVLDVFITSKDKANVDIGSRITVKSEDAPFEVRTFCPEIIEKGEKIPVEKTRYADLGFVPVDTADHTFISLSEDVKPMAEIRTDVVGLAVSAYSNMATVTVKGDGGVVEIDQFDSGSVTLTPGETLTYRVIYGVDYLQEQVEAGEEEPEFTAGILDRII